MLETIIPTPAAIVERAEIELPGFAGLIGELRPLYLAARNTTALGHLSAWRLMARIYLYAQRTEVKSQVFVLNHDPDRQRRGGHPWTAHGLVIARLLKGGVESGGLTQPPHPNWRPTRNIKNWQTEWSRIAPAIGCTGLADLDGLMRFEERVAKEPGGLTAAVERAREEARRRAELHAASARSIVGLSSLARHYARTFARRLAAGGTDRRLLTKEGLVEVLRGLEAGFRESGLSRLASILAAAEPLAEEENDEEAGTGAATAG